MSDRITSEADLISTYLAPLAAQCAGASGLLDDAARIVAPPGQDLVLTTDAVAAGVHFFENDAPEDIAWKALAVNVSDLAGKGAAPLAYQMALAFPDAPARAWMERFAAGLADAQTQFSIVLSGGDTDRRPGPLSITITAVGTVPNGRMPARSGARPGDVVLVSGTLGDAALGLKLRRGDAGCEGWGVTREQRDVLIGRYLRPLPRLALRAVIRDWASAAMDVSDGLVKDLHRLALASGVAARIDVPAVPLSDAARCALTHDAGLIETVISGGDDYEILMTVDEEAAPMAQAEAARAGVRLTPIGRIAAGAGLSLVGERGQNLQPGSPGWDHF